ncbi:propionyl-CoA synthetase [Rhodovarius crocodyli]|uniref:Propionyl-CoA synthetase n=1 Tax=Rhodovarius crocodyli TaxID=1979269 RepID=A0A437MGD5_9PROT|nr:propionyl-CoA synthetase [Rhodovarius crocodyli]RVT96687.1 propionyl-CoA synthetase [Rhodovarius crocodyli]
MDGTTVGYDAARAAWAANPEGWWMECARGLDWSKPPSRAFFEGQGAYGLWFADGELNTCYNALDRHVARGRGDQAALCYDSPVTGTRRRITYAELLSEVERLAGAMAARGVVKGDRVVIYMPMVPEAAMAMLACARLGAIHSVVFGGFAAPELAARIDDAEPRMILAASCGIEPGRIVAYKPLLDAAIDLARHKPDHCLILQRDQQPATMVPGRDVDWREAVAAAAPHPCVPVEATHPLYILYTSGTTGKPKGIVRENGGHAVALHASIANMYGLHAGDVMFTASDVGWVVGHCYIVYGPLMAGLTSVFFEGKPVGTPDASTYWRICEEYGVKVMFTAPTAIRAIKKEDPEGKLARKHDLSRLEAMFLAGERCDPDTVAWAEQLLGHPVIDHWWQTETGWPITGAFRGLGMFPLRHGSGGKAAPGFHVVALDEGGHELPRGAMGQLALRLPLPPGALNTLWRAPDRFHQSYLAHFPGYYDTSDAGMVDADGYVWVMGRTDDVINVAGHRLSTGEMEEVLSGHRDVAECAVIGRSDSLKGQVPMGLVVLKAGVNRPEALVCSELVSRVREHIGPVAAFREVHIVNRLPKTRSGKILRATLRKMADGEDFPVPATIDDPAILDEIAEKLRGGD